MATTRITPHRLALLTGAINHRVAEFLHAIQGEFTIVNGNADLIGDPHFVVRALMSDGENDLWDTIMTWSDQQGRSLATPEQVVMALEAVTEIELGRYYSMLDDADRLASLRSLLVQIFYLDLFYRCGVRTVRQE